MGLIRAVGRGAPSLALTAVLVLSACGEQLSPDDKAVAVPANAAVDASWSSLPDGGFFRRSEHDGDVVVERCRRDGSGYDCLSVREAGLPSGRTLIAGRERLAQLPTAPIASAATGYGCTVYPGPVIEQRLVAEGSGFQRNDDLDGALWTAGDVERMGGGAARGFVDCRALADLIGSSPVDKLKAADLRQVLPERA